MVPIKLLDKVPVPGNGGDLCLYQQGTEFFIRVDGRELMNSSAHYSEDMLAELSCKKIAGRSAVRVLIGGLGMGFTAAATLRSLAPDAEITVAELVPAVIQWNRNELARLTNNVFTDSRLTVREIDLVKLLKDSAEQSFDAILIDVDNGPEAVSRKENNWLYSHEGLMVMATVLRTRGVLAVWSAHYHTAFVKRLRKAGFSVEEIRVREREGKGRKKHTIWLASINGRK